MLVWIRGQWPSNGFVGFHDSGTDGLWEVCERGAVHTKSMFPVQRVAKIVASRAAPFFFFFLGGGGGVWRYIVHFWGQFFFGKNEKKSVSCPAGGQNCGQSGGRILFHILFLVGGGGWRLENIVHFLKKEKRKKKLSSRTIFSHPAAKPET